MTERIISITSYSPLDIYGVNDKNINLIKSYFPKLKIIARGDMVKAIGNKDELDDFEEKFNLLLLNYDKFGKLSEIDIEQIMGEEDNNVSTVSFPKSNDVLVHGRGGLLVKALTENQCKMVESSEKNDLIFAIGPAGTGKTYTAVALAVRALKNKEVKRIILTRPAVEAGENLGFLPGDLRDKLDPYLQPLYDALRDMLPTQKLLKYLEDGTIEIAPLAFMRGRTLDHVFAILDEAQNATEMQLKMFVTRMGRTAKFIVTGDITQIDLPKNQASGLKQAARLLKDIRGIDFIYLDERDVIRHKLVTRIIKAYNSKDSGL
ncbi:MAG: PhoH family protein [Bacteroidetes bacterium]|nr:PhoH family protein [Bacteroidota bacterium]MBL7103570.1 PhoH family protein [Bacteroidales bacterium]